MSNVSVAAVGKSDADRASELKAELRSRLEKVCETLDAANREGIRLDARGAWPKDLMRKIDKLRFEIDSIKQYERSKK